MVFLAAVFSTRTPAEFLMVYPMKETKLERLMTAKVEVSSLGVMWQNQGKDAQSRVM